MFRVLNFHSNRLRMKNLSRYMVHGPLTQVLATLAVLAEESLTQASVQTLSQTLLWMDDKASSPCLKTWGTHRSRHSKSMQYFTYSFIHSFKYIHVDRYLLQSFQVPCSIDN